MSLYQTCELCNRLPCVCGDGEPEEDHHMTELEKAILNVEEIASSEFWRDDMGEWNHKSLGIVLEAAKTAARARDAALEEAAQIIDDLNKQGPYSAIGAASHIRALKDKP